VFSSNPGTLGSISANDVKERGDRKKSRE